MQRSSEVHALSLTTVPFWDLHNYQPSHRSQPGTTGRDGTSTTPDYGTSLEVPDHCPLSLDPTAFSLSTVQPSFEPLVTSTWSAFLDRPAEKYRFVTTTGERLPSIRLKRHRRSSIYENSSSSALSKATSSANHVLVPIRPHNPSQPKPVALLPPNEKVSNNSERLSHTAAPHRAEERPRTEVVELDDLQPPLRWTTAVPNEVVHSPNGSPSPLLNGWRRGRLGKPLWPRLFRFTGSSGDPPLMYEYEDSLVDFLDIIDPEIQILSTLTNVQNSLFVPDLGNLIDRRPLYCLTQSTPVKTSTDPPPGSVHQANDDLRHHFQINAVPKVKQRLAERQLPEWRSAHTTTSHLSEAHYAALPHGMILEGWTQQEKRELDDHVRHMLHSRRSRFKRTMKGFGQYVQRPLGFLVTLYSLLITLFGLAWVLFLLGWIYIGDHQVYVIHIIDSVLVALFAIVGDGLAPFRAVDTYHMAFVIHYTRKIKKANKELQPQSAPRPAVSFSAPSDAVESDISKIEAAGNDPAPGSRIFSISRDPSGFLKTQSLVSRPTRNIAGDFRYSRQNLDLEMDLEKNDDVQLTRRTMHWQKTTPLTPAQCKNMRHHQRKLAKSHSFYKPYETYTHHPFPLSLLIAIVILLDFHSCLQITLGATTWGIDYHHRPAAITTTILCLSITANLASALVITIGDRRTRKKKVVELLERQRLTADAIKHLGSTRALDRDACQDFSPGPCENRDPKSQSRQKSRSHRG